MKVAKSANLAAAPYLDSVIVFGGRHESDRVTFMLSEEGEVKTDFSKDSLIPIFMNLRAFTIRNGKVRAVGERREKYSSKEKVVVFDGKKWADN